MDKDHAYCLKCGKQVKIKDAKKTKFKNGVPVLKGKDSAGHTVYRIVSR